MGIYSEKCNEFLRVPKKYFEVRLSKLIGLEETKKIDLLNRQERQKWFNENSNKLRTTICRIDPEIHINNIVSDEIFVDKRQCFDWITYRCLCC